MEEKNQLSFSPYRLDPAAKIPARQYFSFPICEEASSFPPFPFLLLFASEEEVRQLFASKDEKVNFRRKGEETTTSSVKYRLE